MPPPCSVYCMVTQGDPLSPTIFNVVVYYVISHWVTVVSPTETGEEVIWDMIKDLVDFFYVNDGIVVSHQPERLQRAFNILTYLFGRVGIYKNLGKTVSMACRPCYTPVRLY